MPEANDQFTTTDSQLKILDRYAIKERIGTGGMARVYRAVDKSLERDVAVKVLHEHLADDTTFRARFEREAKFLASFHHPNVIQIFDYDTQEDNERFFCYMVMTYLPGKTLKDIMDEHSEAGRLMPQEQIVQIMTDLASALQYAHELGMVHRDVKPANILFDSTGRAVLTDFGIARMVEHSNLTQENVAVGTPAYMAPEQAAGEEVDTRTDIYALGVILYELLAGKPPFGDDGSISVLLRHLSDPVPPLTSFDHIENDYLDAVIFKALAKSPDMRYQSAIELANDLKEAIENRLPSVRENASQEDLATLVIPASNNPVRKAKITEAITSIEIPRRQNSALGILVAGLAIILALISVAFVMNNRAVEPQPTEVSSNTGVGSMVSGDSGSVPSMTNQENMGITSDFSADDPLLGSYWTLESEADPDRPGMISREAVNDVYRFVNTIPGRAATTILPNYSYTEDYTIVADLALEEGSPNNSGYGIVFHYQDMNNYGVFAVDGSGNYSIWFLIDRNWIELRDAGQDWSPSDAVNIIGESNILRLEIRGSQLTGYVNDTQVTQVDNDALMDGNVGLYLATPSSGDGATALVDMYQTIIVGDGTISSMTADS